eukprot:g3130.t1
MGSTSESDGDEGGSENASFSDSESDTDSEGDESETEHQREQVFANTNATKELDIRICEADFVLEAVSLIERIQTELSLQLTKYYISCDQAVYVLRCLPQPRDTENDRMIRACSERCFAGDFDQDPSKYKDKEFFGPAQFDSNVSPRIRILQVMFGRIVDLYNFHVVLRCLTPNEQEEAAHRLGWLNMFNPVRPLRMFWLDLSKPDERAFR